MPKRDYTHIKLLESEILAMKKSGKTKREIADHYGLNMCRFFGVSRSGYYDYVKRLNQPAHDTELAAMIREQQNKCDKTYGYRRMWKWLKKAKKIRRNPKTIVRIMKKYELLSEIRRRRKWRQMGRQLHKYENLLNREFQLTDQTINGSRISPTSIPVRVYFTCL